MKFVVVLATLLASLTLASPVKRALVTEWEIETVTVTITIPAYAKTTTTSHLDATSTIVLSLPTSTSSTVSPQSTSSGGSSVSEYAAPILLQHNIHRANHSAPDLVWDAYLADVARQHAESCVYGHSKSYGDGDYGQNIGAGAPDNEIGKLITNSMYNGEINFYPGYNGEPNMGNFEVWGHFSQIVWKGTKSVGCYTAHCKTLQNVSGNVAPYFTVCNYKPSGNVVTQFGKNVLPPQGQNSVVL